MAIKSRLDIEEVEKLFKKYQKYLVWLFKIPFVRKYVGVDYMLPRGKELVGVHPQGIIYFNGLNKDGFPMYTAKFQTRLLVAEKLYTLFSFLKYLQLIPALAGSPIPAFALTVNDFVVDSSDAGIYAGPNATYSTVHDATTGTLTEVATNYIYIQNYYTGGGGGDYYVERMFMTYLTGATIPAGATKNSATLSLKTGAIVTNTSGYTAEVVQATPANDTSIAAGDFDQQGTTSFGSGTIPAADTDFSDITINASGLADISIGSGNTAWGLRVSGDVNNTAPVNQDHVMIRSGDHATSADRPTLTVDYTAGTAYTRDCNETLTLVQTFNKTTARSFALTLILVQTFSKSLSRSLIETLILVQTFTRGWGRSFAETLILVETFGKSIGKTLNETLILVQTLNKLISRSLNETLVLVQTFTKAIVKSLNETLILVQTFSREFGRSFTETLILVQTFGRAIGKRLTEAITLSDTLSKLFDKIWKIPDILNLSPNIDKPEGIVSEKDKPTTGEITDKDKPTRV